MNRGQHSCIVDPLAVIELLCLEPRGLRRAFCVLRDGQLHMVWAPLSCADRLGLCLLRDSIDDGAVVVQGLGIELLLGVVILILMRWLDRYLLVIDGRLGIHVFAGGLAVSRLADQLGLDDFAPGVALGIDLCTLA